MAIDFSRLVMRPAVAVFGEAVTCVPLVSDPGAPAFQARGVFDALHEVVEMKFQDARENYDGVPVTSQAPVLGIRLADWPVVPKKGDQVTVQAVAYRVWDVQLDGQGKADLILKKAA